MDTNKRKERPLSYIADYLKAGYTGIFPVDYGKKFPPPKHVTGRYPAISSEKLKELWGEMSGKTNFALRTQTSSAKEELIALDLDEYGDKHGLACLADFTESNGLSELPLPELFRSSSRGADNLGGQYLFRVPADVKWVANLGGSVEVVQLTHRYAIVWPSVVEGRQYEWLKGSEVVDLPPVADLPQLPDDWQAALKRGARRALTEPSPAHANDYTDATRWLQDNLGGWSEPMSSAVREAAEAPQDGGAHDHLIATVNKIINLSVLGQGGGSEAIRLVARWFITEMANRESGARRLSQEEAAREFKGAVVWSANNISVDRIIPYRPDPDRLDELVVPASALTSLFNKEK